MRESRKMFGGRLCERPDHVGLIEDGSTREDEKKIDGGNCWVY